MTARSGKAGSRFSDSLVTLPITARQRLDDVLRIVDPIPFGRTDCALPMLKALQEGWDIDTFIIYTDSETWAGHVHPVQALQQYRERRVANAKLVVCGMVANDFTIADPADRDMLDVVGFDTSTPAAISSFSRGV